MDISDTVCNSRGGEGRETSFRVAGAPPFTEPLELQLSKRCNVFVGINGTGKSTLLKLISKLPVVRLERQTSTEEETPFDTWWDPRDAIEGKPVIYVGATRTELNTFSVFLFLRSIDRDSIFNKLRFGAALIFRVILYVATVLMIDHLSDDLKQIGQAALFGLYFGAVIALILTDIVRSIPIVVRFFTRRGRHYIADASLVDDDISSVFLADKVQGVMRSWLGTGHNPNRTLAAAAGIKASTLASECAQQIAPEAFVPGGLPGTAAFPQARNPLDRWLRRHPRVQQHMFTFDTVYSADKLHLSNLSAGTQGPLLFIWWMALKMASFYQFREGWENRPAVLVIDEIENHLHPTWQRRVIPVLLSNFPQLQIFASTHSPFVLAGLKRGEIHLLERNPESAAVICSTNDYDIVGWTADEILQVYLTVLDPTDESTAVDAEELRTLLDEGMRKDPDAEHERQLRIESLRQTVHPNVRAGSVTAAADEKFVADLERVLIEFRNSQSTDAS